MLKLFTAKLKVTAASLLMFLLHVIILGLKQSASFSHSVNSMKVVVVVSCSSGIYKKVCA